ncbi:MAG: hypothetical protein HY866_14640, partial [Chloroflexi bacterium]|nr:hypothetical protein [Chloroflexota bacterium]
MGQEQAKQLLQQGIAAAKGGRPDIARQSLQQVVRLDPQNETAWLWLSSVMAEPKERMFCLKRLLEINPQNEFALKGLRAMGIDPAQTAAPVPGSSIPVLDEAKYNRVMQTAEEFLRRYNPQPPDRLDIRWTQKKKKRYNEGGTTHLRQFVYFSAVLVVLLLVGGIGLIFTQVNPFGAEGTPVGVINTLIPSRTPLFLPTFEGATPTPFNDPMAVPATRVPTGLKQGN